MNIKHLLLTVLASGLFFASSAQVEEKGLPYAISNPSILIPIQFIPLPSIDIDALKEEDELEEMDKHKPVRFAYAHEVNLDLYNSGSWQWLPGGGRLWRLGLESANAFSLNITFSQFNLPEGTKVFLYNEDKSHVLGAFTQANNKENGQLGTAPVKGDHVIIELYEPPHSLYQAKLSISHVAHDYKDAFKMAKGFGDSGGCNNNVNCPVSAGWEDQISSVALITLASGTRWCSGSMIGNTTGDETPYFLTADHCLNGTENTWVFYFNYESATCTPNVNGSLGQSVSGATVRASSSSSDFALLELSTDVPASYNVFFNGWDKTGVAATTSTAIHHPSGDVKKFSVENDPVTSNGDYWRVNDWDDGTTEGGSSGSPLFDQNKRVVGQLFGGFAACINNEWDDYGKISSSWIGSGASVRLSDWLDPINSGSDTLNGYYPVNNSITEEKSSFAFKVFPNPTDGRFRIQLGTEAAKNIKIRVLDALGRIVLDKKLSGTYMDVDIRDRSAGVYLIKIESETASAVQRVQVMH